jgi:Skp family chaperone for outer membrane proteins
MVFSCASQQTNPTTVSQCGVVNIHSLLSRSNSARAAEEKISQEFANQQRELKALKDKADFIEQTLENDAALSETRRSMLSSDLVQLYIDIHSSEDQLNHDQQKRRDDYNRYLLDYFMQILNAKSKSDGIDIVMSKNGKLLINRKGIVDINCGASFVSYTDYIIDITNR